MTISHYLLRILATGALALFLSPCLGGKIDEYSRFHFGRESLLSMQQSQAFSPPRGNAEGCLDAVSMSLAPSIVRDGDPVDLFIEYPQNATIHDYITLSCFQNGTQAQSQHDVLDARSAEYIDPEFPLCDVQVAVGSQACPAGYVRHRQNLNEDAGGDALHFCYSNCKGSERSDRTVVSNLLVVAVHESDSSTLVSDVCPHDYEVVDIDLNNGTHVHTSAVFLCIQWSTWNRSDQHAVFTLTTVNADSVLPPCPDSFEGAGANLNFGAGGEYIRLCVLRASSQEMKRRRIGTVPLGPLYYFRCNYTVDYVRVGSDNAQCLGTLQAEMYDSPGTPKHGHLSLGGSGGEMWVQYSSAYPWPRPEVRYGAVSLAHDMSACIHTGPVHRCTPRESDLLTALGNSTTYAARDMCGAPANVTSQQWFFEPGYLHRVLLSDLNPGYLYAYQYGNDVLGWSDVHFFRMPVDLSTDTVATDVLRVNQDDTPFRIVGTGIGDTRFLVVGDLGTSPFPGTEGTFAHMREDVWSEGYSDFALFIGDLSYGMGSSYLWEKFMSMLETLATLIPIQVSIGNHEYDYTGGDASKDPSHPASGSPFSIPSIPKEFQNDGGGECAIPTVARFAPPRPIGNNPGNGIFWYSFRSGLVHVIQLSSEHDWTRESAQYLWLKRELSQVNRTRTPWLVVTSHRMMYTTQLCEWADHEVAGMFRDEVEPLLTQYKVNLMLVGHQHSYERACPVRQGHCVTQGTVHVVVGTGGAELEICPFSSKLGKFSQQRMSTFGYMRISANRNRLLGEFIGNEYNSEAKVIRDRFELLPWQ